MSLGRSKFYCVKCGEKNDLPNDVDVDCKSVPSRKPIILILLSVIAFISTSGFVWVLSRNVDSGFPSPVNGLNFVAKPMLVTEDFNGDGLIDMAGVVTNRKGENRLSAFMRNRQNQFTEITLWDLGESTENLYVVLIPSGPRDTLCSVNPGACDPGDPKRINLKHPGIAFGVEEASEVDFYWNDAQQKFENAFISD